MSNGPWSVVGGCGGAGGSLITLAIGLVAAAAHQPVSVVDLDPVGIHAQMAGVDAPRTVADLMAVEDGITATHLRAAAYPHPHAGALVPAAMTPEVEQRVALLARMAQTDERPRLLVDCGSGPIAADVARASRDVILVVSRDAPGVRAAQQTREVLGDLRPTVVINQGSRREDVSRRTITRLIDGTNHIVVPRSDVDARAVATGSPIRRRAAFTRAIAEVAIAAGILATPGEGS